MKNEDDPMKRILQAFADALVPDDVYEKPETLVERVTREAQAVVFPPAEHDELRKAAGAIGCLTGIVQRESG